MKAPRSKLARGLLAAVCTAVFALAAPALGQSQATYPTKPVRMIVPFTPGGGADTVARVLAPKLSEVFGQPVIVENRPGASTIIGGDIAAKAPPDGHALFMATFTNAVNPSLHPKSPWDITRDFSPVSLLATVSAGQVPMTFGNNIATLPHIKSGRLRALGVTSAKRSSLMPEVPTMIEGGLPGFVVVGWYAIATAAGTPQAAVSRLNAELVRALHDSEVKRRLEADGTEIVGSSPAEFAAFLNAEIEKWGKVVRTAGIQPN